MAIYQGHNEDSSGNLLLSIGNGMTATVETGSTASQSYTKGSYLFFNNRLCKAASAIASGATLTIGGNLTQTSLGAEITSHLRSSDGKEFYFDVKDGTYGYYPSASKVASEFVPFGGTGGNCVKGFSRYTFNNIYYYIGMSNDYPDSDMVISVNTYAPSVSLDGITLSLTHLDDSGNKRATISSTKAGKLYVNDQLKKTWTSSDLSPYTFTGNWTVMNFNFRVLF